MSKSEKTPEYRLCKGCNEHNGEVVLYRVPIKRNGRKILGKIICCKYNCKNIETIWEGE